MSARSGYSSPLDVRRRALLGLVLAAIVVPARPARAAGVVDVYKSPSCGCCGGWVAHMRANGFTVRVNDVADVDAVRVHHRVPAALAACHTALVDGYVVQGHVPAREVRRLIAERPAALGVAVPGMPASAPGMDAAGGAGYEVLLFAADGTTRLFARYPRG